LLAIPLTKKSSLKNPPAATIAIILVNVLIFIIFQTNDGERYAAAENFYFESGLDKVEIPLYLDFLEDHRPQEYQKTKDQIDANKLAGEQGVYSRLKYDTPFIDLLEEGQLA
jgi:hypothetical protein